MCPPTTMRRHKLNLFPAGMYGVVVQAALSAARMYGRIPDGCDLHPSARRRILLGPLIPNTRGGGSANRRIPRWVG